MFFSYSLTPDVELKMMQVKHSRAFCELIENNQDHLKPWFDWAWEEVSLDGIKEYIESTLRTFAEGGGFDTGIWHKGKLIGLVGITHVDRRNRKAELSYWLDKNSVGKGLASLATSVVIDHVFGEMEMNRVDLRVDPNNARSKALINRLGAKYEGTLRQHIWINGKPVDLEMYSILKHEWEARQL